MVRQFGCSIVPGGDRVQPICLTSSLGLEEPPNHRTVEHSNAFGREMWIIVDGYNVIRQWPELAMLDRTDLQSGREALLRELRSYRRNKGHRITVVFDGREQGGFSEATEHVGGVAVRYSRQGETADAVIARLVREGGSGILVVSSDREVSVATRRQGAACVSSLEFIEKVEASRLASMKGGEEEDRPVKVGKGTSRRLTKAERQLRRRVRSL